MNSTGATSAGDGITSSGPLSSFTQSLRELFSLHHQFVAKELSQEDYDAELAKYQSKNEELGDLKLPPLDDALIECFGPGWNGEIATNMTQASVEKMTEEDLYQTFREACFAAKKSDENLETNLQWESKYCSELACHEEKFGDKWDIEQEGKLRDEYGAILSVTAWESFQDLLARVEFWRTRFSGDIATTFPWRADRTLITIVTSLEQLTDLRKIEDEELLETELDDLEFERATASAIRETLQLPLDSEGKTVISPELETAHQQAEELFKRVAVLEVELDWAARMRQYREQQ